MKKIDQYGGIPFIENCIKQGMSQQEVADKLRINKSTIYDYLIQNHTSWNYLKKKHQRHIIDDYGGVHFLKLNKSKGLTQKQIEDKIGVKGGTISRYTQSKNINWKKL